MNYQRIRRECRAEVLDHIKSLPVRALRELVARDADRLLSVAIACGGPWMLLGDSRCVLLATGAAAVELSRRRVRALPGPEPMPFVCLECSEQLSACRCHLRMPAFAKAA